MECTMQGLPANHHSKSLLTHVHWVNDAFQPAYPLSSPSPPAFIFPSIRVFSKEPVSHIRWPKYWTFSFSISPSKEHPGLIFRMDWLDLLAVQGTLKSLQHHSSKESILRHSAFFIVQLTCIHGKPITPTRQTFVGKVLSLLFNMLSKLVIAFLPNNNCLLISWLQSPSAVIWEPTKNKVCNCFHCFSIYLPWSDVTRCHLSFLNAEL